MSIKAKFVCTYVTDFGDSKKIQMNPVVSGDGNLDYSRYTPSGSIELYITNPDAFNQFEPKQEYYITFEKVE